MPKKINVIILGGSINSTIAETHVRSLLITRKYNIIGGIFSKNQRTNIKTGLNYGLSKDKIFSNINTLIRNIKFKIDFAILITPPSIRFDYIKKLAENNINIICEKPMTNNILEAKKINNIVKKNKIYFVLSYNYIFYPALIEIKNNLRQLGKIKYFIFEMAQQGFLLNKTRIKKWRLKDDQVPTLHLDLGSHLISLMKFFFNKYPLKIRSNLTKDKRHKIIETASSNITYKDFSGHIWFTKSALGENNNLTLKIYGTKGTYKWNHSEPEIVKFWNIKGENKVLERYSKKVKFINNKKFYGYVPGHPSGFQDTFTNFYNIVYKDFFKKANFFEKSILIKNLDGFKIMKVLNKISN